MCDYCGEAPSTVYCEADTARLCLSCDRHVHAANAVSKRHSRALLCDGCNLRPAVVRCLKEKLSLCQSCDADKHESSPVASHNNRLRLEHYTGCPSAAALSQLWGCDLGEPAKSITHGIPSMDTHASNLVDHKNIGHLISSSKKQKDTRSFERENDHSTTNKRISEGENSTSLAESSIQRMNIPDVSMLIDIPAYSGQVINGQEIL